VLRSQKKVEALQADIAVEAGTQALIAKFDAEGRYIAELVKATLVDGFSALHLIGRVGRP
jgi:hypothetical protein